MRTASHFIEREGAYYLQGAIDFNNASAWQRASVKLFENANKMRDQLVFNFSQLQATTNSAALALIIEWLKLARQNNMKLKFVAFPQALLSVAQVADAEQLFADCLE